MIRMMKMSKPKKTKEKKMKSKNLILKISEYGNIDPNELKGWYFPNWFEKEHFEVVTELDETIYAEVDSEKMKQAIGNLLSNAIKYSSETKKILIRLFRKSGQVRIEIEDHGIGIPEDKLSRIFEQFYRIDQKEGVSGTGLGLTVVKEIVEGHNGTISVTSETGNGSKFVITLNQQTVKSENNISN